MAALQSFEVVFITRQLGHLGGLQRKAELGIQVTEGRRQHGLDVDVQRLRLAQVVGHAGKGVAVHRLDAQLDAGLFEFVRQPGQLDPQRREAEQVEQLAPQRQVNRAHGLNARTTGVKLHLLLLNAGKHMFDDRHVFSAQAAQFGHLFGQVTAANVQ